ncbi:MAG: DUF4391 domain-containing protein [Kiritimatiellae bacterium]|nr:DUF4391 domain-containing protein [Kiritimatiellia bacterium]
MIEFPQSAAYGKKIPFVQLKKQGLPARFSEWMKSLVWAYKLSPATVNLAATESVREIEVMDLTLKEKCSTLRTLATLITAIDGLIPSPLIFRVFSEDGEGRGIAFNLKASGGALYGTSDMFRLFRTEGDVALPSGVVDLESLFKNLAATVAGMTVLPGETLKDLDARHYRAESLRAALAEIEKKLSRETQLDRKYALAKEKQRIEKEIKQCQNSKK